MKKQSVGFWVGVNVNTKQGSRLDETYVPSSDPEVAKRIAEERSRKTEGAITAEWKFCREVR